MSKIILSDITSLSNDQSATAQVNTNFDTIENAFDNTLSRDGTSPNQMGSNLDMNSFKLLNVPTPLGPTDVVRLQDVASFSGGTLSPLPAGGSTGNFLRKNSNANYDFAWSTALAIASTKTFTVSNSLTLAGVDGTTLTVNTPFTLAGTTGTLTFQGSDTYVGRATTDTLTNKTLTTPTITSPSITGTVVVNSNTGAPVAPTFASPIQMVGADATITALTLDTYGAAGLINLRTAGGTRASKTAMAANTQLFNLAGSGWNGSAYASYSPIVGFSGETWSGTANGSYSSFFTVALTTTPQTEKMRLQPSGGLTLGNAIIATDPGAGSFLANGQITTSGTGIGYSTGAGGTVTQITSRTTGVTLNKSTGAITLLAGAPTVGTWVSFTVTNSTVAATDIPHVAIKSGTNTYIAHVTGVAAGSFQISITSIVGTSSDSPVINFAILKGVTS